MTEPLVEAAQGHLAVNGKAYWAVGGRTPVLSGSHPRSRKCRRPMGRDAMITWLSAGEGLVAAAIAVIGVVFTFTANRRAQYDRVLALTAESATRQSRMIAISSAKCSNRHPSFLAIGQYS